MNKDTAKHIGARTTSPVSSAIEKLFDVKQVQLVKDSNWYEISLILPN